jgi:hypothetical protein
MWGVVFASDTTCLTSRGHTIPTATTALSPLPANIRLPDGMSCQALESASHT